MSGDPRSKVWLLLLALAGAAVASFWYGFKAWRENRLVGDTPISRVRSAAQGYIELRGRGVPMPNARASAPLTGKPCTWWRYKIEQRSSDGRSRTWSIVDSGTSDAPFLLDDGTGQCLVYPRGAEVFANAKDVWYGSTNWPDVRIPDGTGFFGKLADALLAGGRYRYTEYRMQPNEPVCALGEYRSGGSATERPDQAVAELLRAWKQDQQTLLARFDANRDGVLDAGEWEHARAEAHRQVVESMVIKPQSGELSVLAKPADGRAFLLSASDGESLARTLRRKSLAALAACLGSSAALVWMASHV